MNQITVRKATIFDLETIQEISSQTFIETFGEANTLENIENYIQKNFHFEQVASEINNPESLFYLAVMDNETIAYLKLNFGKAQTEIGSPKSMEIQRIYVLKKNQRKKIGQLLLKEAIKIAQQSEVDTIWLGVWEKNYKAIQFYNQNDFVEFGTHNFTMGKEVQTDLLMQRRISI